VEKSFAALDTNEGVAWTGGGWHTLECRNDFGRVSAGGPGGRTERIGVSHSRLGRVGLGVLL